MCSLSGFVAGYLTDLRGSGAFPDLRFGVEWGRSEVVGRTSGLVGGYAMWPALGAVHFSEENRITLLLGHREL